MVLFYRVVNPDAEFIWGGMNIYICIFYHFQNLDAYVPSILTR